MVITLREFRFKNAGLKGLDAQLLLALFKKAFMK